MMKLYILDRDLDDLEQLESELEHDGIARSKLRVASDDEAGASRHHLHGLIGIRRREVFRYGLIGAGLGLLLAIPISVSAWLAPPVYFLPVLFLALFLLGFCCWEGGLLGIQKQKRLLKPFQRALAAGQHLFIIDIDDKDIDEVKTRIAKHPKCQLLKSPGGQQPLTA
jgi:hypothetical protein